MKNYETLSEAINDLQKQGYTTDFNIAFDSLQCRSTGKCLMPSEFEVTNVYRFDGMTNPDDEAILYVIESLDKSMKGTLVNGYGAFSEDVSAEIIEKLRIRH